MLKNHEFRFIYIRCQIRDILKKAFRFLFTIYGLIVFILVMLLLFPFVIVASFFGRVKGGNMVYDICRVWADVVLFFWGIRHKNYFDAPKHTEEAVVYVFNHLSYIDIPFLLKIFRRHHIRVLGKAEMMKYPVFGLFYKMAAIPVKRTSAEDRARSILEMKKYLRLGTSIVMAPEGTFNKTHKPLKEFYDGAFKVAIDTQTNIQPVIILDGYNRMPYETLFSLNPGRSRAHFLPVVKAEGLTMDDMVELKETVYKQMEEALIKYRASWIKDI